MYKGKVAVERNFFTYALFVSFFPQLVAGPIERSTNLLPQFHEKKVFSYENIMSGVRLMLWGYFLKLALADRCGLYVDPVLITCLIITAVRFSLLRYCLLFRYMAILPAIP